MTDTSTAPTRAFFHHYAQEFDAIYSTRNTLINRIINRTFRRSMELRHRKTLDGCYPIQGRRVLDVGCGPGHYGVALARAGAAQVIGLDFAEGMLERARQHAVAAGVSSRCAFVAEDFMSYQPEEQFDYVIVMGVMDYVARPEPLIQKVLSMTRSRAFFSFPAGGTLLAWQRRQRYRLRCPLFLYRHNQVAELMQHVDDAQVTIEPMARDFFVTVSKA